MTDRDILKRLVAWYGYAKDEIRDVYIFAAIHGQKFEVPEDQETLDKIMADVDLVLDRQEQK